MPSFTLQNLIDRAASIADQHDEFVLPAEWLAWANVELTGLDILMARQGWIKNQLDNTSVSSAPYLITLPSASLALLGVWEVDSSGRYRLLRHTDIVSFQHQSPINGPITGAARTYSVEIFDSDDMIIRFFPRPTSGRYVAMSLPSSTLFTDLTSSATFPLGFEEWIVCRLARRALLKEESSTGAVEKLIAEQELKISEVCWARQMAEVPSIRKRVQEWSEDPLYPEVDRWRWL